MTRYLLVFHQDHTPGDDSLERIPYLGAVIEADSLRKAQNAAKKLFPRIRFGGMFSPLLLEATSQRLQLYAGKADTRLTREHLHLHRATLENLS